MKKKCPKCLSPINKQLTACVCGWQEASENVQKDDRCHFTSKERRCPLIGAISDGKKKQNLLCFAHWFARNDVELSKQILEDIETQPTAWLNKLKNWRSELLEEHLKKQPKVIPSKKITLEEKIIKAKKFLLPE